MPRTGLRLSEQERRDSAAEYQNARFHDDLDRCLRIQGLFLVSRGNRDTDVAEVIGVGRRTFQDWIHRYRLRGIPGLTKGPFMGPKSRLTDAQKAELSRITAAGAQGAGLDTGVWTTTIIVKLVKDLFGVSYHPDHMIKILHGLRFSVQYPGRQLSKADEKAQQTWILEELPAIKKSRRGARRNPLSRRSGVSAGRHQDMGSRRHRIPGIGPPVRKSIKIMGAVRIGANPQWHSRFVKGFNADTFIEFLDQLLRYYRGTKIHLITDNAPYHKSPKVREWLIGKEHPIELYFLPAYSPKLNAVEYVWRKTKRASTHNKFFARLQDLKQALARRFNGFQGNPDSHFR